MSRYIKINDEDKRRLYDAHQRGKDHVELARQLGIKRTTAWAIINRAQDNGDEVSRPRGSIQAQRVRVSEELTQTAVTIVEEHPEFTLDQVNAELHARLPHHIRVGRTTIARVLQGQLIMMKKQEDAPVERNSQRVKEERFAFANWLMGEGIRQQLIFVDEAGINLWCRRTRELCESLADVEGTT